MIQSGLPHGVIEKSELCTVWVISRAIISHLTVKHLGLAYSVLKNL